MKTGYLYFILIALGSLDVGCQPRTDAEERSILVQVGTPERRDIPVYREWVGHLNGTINANILPQVSGYLVSQSYRNGSYVHEGDLLFRIDDKTFRDRVKQAEGNFAKARASWQESDYNRNLYAPLAKEDAISQQKYQDSVLSTEAAQADLIAAEAALTLARQELAYTEVTSPISGIAGMATAQIGDLVSPTGDSLTTVSTVDPIRIEFAVSQNEWTEQEKLGSSYSMGLGLGNKLDVYLPNGEQLPQQATIVAIDRAFSTTTGSILLRAHLDNDKNELKPGMFVRVRSQIGLIPNALTVPVHAILSTQGRSFVVLLDQNNRPHLLPVRTGAIAENRQVIEALVPSSLNEKTRLVINGIQQAALIATTHSRLKLQVEPYATQGN